MKKTLSFFVLLIGICSLSPATMAQVNRPVAQNVPHVQTAQKASVSAYRPRYYRTDTVKNTDSTLNGQYTFMLSRSKTVNGYKLVNPYRLSGLWQSVSDTLRKERQALKKAQAKVKEFEEGISTIKDGLSGKEEQLNIRYEEINKINFLGIKIDKGTYHLFVWSLIAILAIALIVVIARSAKNILEARHRTQLYDEISAEFQAFKSKANEKERKLARELQDERNLVEELKGKM